MCVVSMVGDFYWDKFKDYNERFIIPASTNAIHIYVGISRDEFDNLKKEVETMKELLKRAKLYDEKNNEPGCEIADKMDFLRKIAELVGIDLDKEIMLNGNSQKKG